MPDEIRLHDVVEMRKKHPCGSAIWTVTRIGADIKMKCAGCGRVVMLDRVEFLRRRKRLVTPGPDAPEVTLGLAGHMDGIALMNPPPAPGRTSSEGEQE